MPAAMSTQLCERVIVWYHEMHVPVDEIVTLSALSCATVYNILQLYNDHGSLHNPLILGLISANPTMFLDEIQDHLAETRNIE
ncbi:hypothetical protein EDB19DRAFT_1739577, partial [Suillus lakei]